MILFLQMRGPELRKVKPTQEAAQLGRGRALMEALGAPFKAFTS